MKTYQIWTFYNNYICRVSADTPLLAMKKALIFGQFKNECDLINFKRSYNENDYDYEVINVETGKRYLYKSIYEA